MWLQEKSCRTEVLDLGVDSIGPGASDRNAGSGAQVQEHKSGTAMGLMLDRWGVHPHGDPVPTPSFYKNRIFKDSWHQAEVGGSPRLKLLPLIFKRPSADAAAQFLTQFL